MSRFFYILSISTLAYINIGRKISSLSDPSENSLSSKESEISITTKEIILTSSVQSGSMYVLAI